MQRFRFAWAWTVGVVLAVAPAAAQTPIIEVVSGGTTLRGEIADFPPCLAGKPRLIYALDGASATDCTVGGGGTEVLCSCQGETYAAVGGGGPHAATHENGGADEVDVTGLAGLLATPQRVTLRDDLSSELFTTDVVRPPCPLNVDEDEGVFTASWADTCNAVPPAFGGLGVDASAFLGLVFGDGAGVFSVVSDLAGLNSLLGSTIPNEDTTCNSAGVTCLFAASASEGGAATTAAALAANGANCAAGEWAAGVDAAGAAEGCAADDDVPEAGDFGALALTGDVTSAGLATSLAADSVGLAELAACPGPAEIVEYGASGVPSCIATPSGGGIGGSTGATDNAVLRADGTGGATLQGSLPTVDDNGVLTVATNTSAARSARFKGPATGAAACAECGEVDVGGGGSGLELRLIFNWNTGHARIQNGYASGGMDFWVGGANNVEALDLSAVGVVMFWSQETAPATCTAGRSLYADTSGALCWCSATNTWENLSAVGSCV
jgi:hypothetical protein